MFLAWGTTEEGIGDSISKIGIGGEGEEWSDSRTVWGMLVVRGRNVVMDVVGVVIFGKVVATVGVVVVMVGEALVGGVIVDPVGME